MHSFIILVSVLFFVTPLVEGGGSTLYTTFPTGSQTWDKYQAWLSFLTTLVPSTSNQLCVHSSGGAAGGIISEGQGYGVFIGASVLASLSTSDSRYSTALNDAYQLFKCWKQMCILSNTGSNNCQSSNLCPDTTVSPVAYYPCLPNWKFNDQLGAWDYGSASDGDIDGITGTCLLAAATASNKPTWWNEVAQWCYASAIQFYTNNVEQDTVGGVAEAVLKLGSCWGGLTCVNPSYFAPGHYQFISNWMGAYGPGLGKSASEISTYQANYVKLISSSYKIILSNQNTAGLTTNWYIPNSNTLSSAGTVSSSCDGSGTPIDQFGSEAARGVWRVALDFVWFGSANSKLYLDKVAVELCGKLTGSTFNNLDTGGFVNSIFASWLQNAFIYGPTFSGLVVNGACSSTATQQSALSAATSIVSGGTITDYYAGSWNVIATLTLCGDLGKSISFVGGTSPPPPQTSTSGSTTPPPQSSTSTTGSTKTTTTTGSTTPPPQSSTSTTGSTKTTTTTGSTSGKYTCTLKGCAINLYYIEFNTTTTSTANVNTATITCSDGRSIPCTVSVSGVGGKYACTITNGVGCVSPIPVLNGVNCPLSIPNTGQTCASGSGTNSWWLEFVPPVSNYNVNIGTVLCADGRFQGSCTDGGGKLECPVKEDACTNPAPIYDGSFCLFPGTASSAIPNNAIVSDASASGYTGSFPVWGIALIISGCVVVVIVLVITIAVIRRKRSAEEIV